MAGARGGYAHPRARATAVVLLVLSVGAVLAVLGWSLWLCTDASYSCPAQGCGNVPQQNCRASGTLALDALGVGAPIAVLSLLVLVRLRRPRGSVPPSAAT